MDMTPSMNIIVGAIILVLAVVGLFALL